MTNLGLQTTFCQRGGLGHFVANDMIEDTYIFTLMWLLLSKQDYHYGNPTYNV